MTPTRVQRQRARGWRMPENTAYVGRGTRWGNPYKVVYNPYTRYWEIRDSLAGGSWCGYKHFHSKTAAMRVAADLYEGSLTGESPLRPPIKLGVTIKQIREELAGKNLACWCPPDKPCHADVLLRIANPEPREKEEA